jgi:hypothetical protein
MIPRRIQGFAWAIVFGLAASATNAGPSLSPELLAGYWYSEFDSDVFPHSHVFSLMHRRPDGSFDAEFLICSPTHTLDQLETGHWRVSGNQLFSTLESIQGEPADGTTVYDPVEVGNAALVLRISGGDAYKHGGAKEFREVRVSADSKLPGCSVTS